jgi:hypothetical protein
MGRLRCASEYYRSVAYASYLNIMLGHAHSVRLPINVYIITIDKVVGEIYTFLSDSAFVVWRDGRGGGMHIDHVILDFNY